MENRVLQILAAVGLKLRARWRLIAAGAALFHLIVFWEWWSREYACRRGPILSWSPPEIAISHLVGDAGTSLLYVLFYFAIEAVIRPVEIQAGDGPNPHRPILDSLRRFVLFCGIDHAASVASVWWPAYRINGATKTAMLIVSADFGWRLWRARKGFSDAGRTLLKMARLWVLKGRGGSFLKGLEDLVDSSTEEHRRAERLDEVVKL